MRLVSDRDPRRLSRLGLVQPATNHRPLRLPTLPPRKDHMTLDLTGHDMAAIRAANQKATTLNPAELDAMSDEEHWWLALEMYEIATKRFFAASIEELSTQVPEYLEIRRKECEG